MVKTKRCRDWFRLQVTKAFYSKLLISECVLTYSINFDRETRGYLHVCVCINKFESRVETRVPENVFMLISLVKVLLSIKFYFKRNFFSKH